jgi:hypothetical protein
MPVPSGILAESSLIAISLVVALEASSSSFPRLACNEGANAAIAVTVTLLWGPVPPTVSGGKFSYCSVSE